MFAGRRWRHPLTSLLVAVAVLALLVGLPASVRAEQQFSTWHSPQFGMQLAHPTTWNVVEERSDPERGDVLVLGNETSALLVGLLHDTRSPREMAQDLIQAQKAQTPDLAVVQSETTASGSVLMFLQYTINPGTETATLIDEKALVGTLQAGLSTVTVRGMVPDRANVEDELEQMERIIATLTPDR
ncbi:MAG: hypothetical protein U0893_13035 [Chloroflexota bacterium]